MFLYYRRLKCESKGKAVGPLIQFQIGNVAPTYSQRALARYLLLRPLPAMGIVRLPAMQ